ncbi:MAG: DnaA regulatory inactivator Hda [Pseudomonadota bacterium]|nr:DnaA regulatory inactivator Hda [Pseudomonadota bacterium]
MRYPPDQRFETFVAADGDAAAAQVRALADGRGHESLYMVGAEGTGKTHLALAACAESETHGRSAAYLAPTAARGRLHQALEGLHARALVAVDGIDAVVGEREDERALFNFHNRVHDAGGRVLYTATRLPDGLDWTLPDLHSRLSQCARIALSPLDDAGRREVLRRRAERRGLQMDAAAVEWLLQHVERDLASLTALLDTLDRASLAAQRRITLPFVREVLASHAWRA